MLPLWLRTVRFTVLLPGTVTVVVPSIIVAIAHRGEVRAPSGLAWIGLAPLALGLGLYAWTAACFAVIGRGTPAPWDAPRRLVTGGPYAVSRNPMYVAVAAVVLGVAVLLRSPWLAAYACAVAAAFHIRAVRYEERVLTATFGEEYRAYCLRTPRWIGTRRSRSG